MTVWCRETTTESSIRVPKTKGIKQKGVHLCLFDGRVNQGIIKSQNIHLGYLYIVHIRKNLKMVFSLFLMLLA